MSFYTEMRTMADELLTEFGIPETDPVILTWERAFDPDEDEPGKLIHTDYEVKVVIKLKYLDGVEGGTLIDASRREVIMSAYMTNGLLLPVIPTGEGFKLTFDGETWTVDSGAAVSPGGTTNLFKLDIVK